MAYLEIGKGVCHNASEGRRHSRGASIIEIGAACGTFIMGVDPTTDTTDSVCKKFMDVFLYPTCLTLARKPCFATFAGVRGGGGATPPWRFQTKRRRASRKRPADCSRRALAIGGIIFGPWSIF